MKKSRFTDSPIMAVLKRVEGGLLVPEICLELCISSATFYKWRAKFGGGLHGGTHEGARRQESAP